MCDDTYNIIIGSRLNLQTDAREGGGHGPARTGPDLTVTRPARGAARAGGAEVRETSRRDNARETERRERGRHRAKLVTFH